MKIVTKGIKQDGFFNISIYILYSGPVVEVVKEQLDSSVRGFETDLAIEQFATKDFFRKFWVSVKFQISTVFFYILCRQSGRLIGSRNYKQLGSLVFFLTKVWFETQDCCVHIYTAYKVISESGG